MKKEKSEILIRRIFVRGLILSLLIILTIFIFTKSLLYCIMFSVGSGISFLGYFLMIRVVDRVIGKRKGIGIFLLTGLGKLVLISAVFILISRYSEPAVLFYLLGLSVIIFSIVGEGGRQVFRSFKDGT